MYVWTRQEKKKKKKDNIVDVYSSVFSNIIYIALISLLYENSSFVHTMLIC